MVLPTGSAVAGSLLALALVMAWRIREGRTPVSVRKIVIPPLGMSTGFSMFVVPAFRIPWMWAAAAFVIGAVALSYPLVATTRLVRQGDTIMMRRSAAFFSVIIGLAAIRLLARGYLDALITAQQTGGLMFVLAFGMIVRWRAQMFFEYKRLTQPETA